MTDDDQKNHRLQSVEIDQQSLGAISRDQEQERQITSSRCRPSGC